MQIGIDKIEVKYASKGKHGKLVQVSLFIWISKKDNLLCSRTWPLDFDLIGTVEEIMNQKEKALLFIKSDNSSIREIASFKINRFPDCVPESNYNTVSYRKKMLDLLYEKVHQLKDMSYSDTEITESELEKSHKTFMEKLNAMKVKGYNS